MAERVGARARAAATKVARGAASLAVVAGLGCRGTPTPAVAPDAPTRATASTRPDSALSAQLRRFVAQHQLPGLAAAVVSDDGT